MSRVCHICGQPAVTVSKHSEDLCQACLDWLKRNTILLPMHAKTRHGGASVAHGPTKEAENADS